MRVHALIIGYLKSQMPSFFGIKDKQNELIDHMDDVFRTVQREHHIPTGAHISDLECIVIHHARRLSQS